MLRASTCEFRFLQSDPEQATVVLLMPPSEQLTWQDGDLFSPMDQNLTKGDLWPHRDGLQCVKVSTWKLTEAVLCGADLVSSHLLQSGRETMVFTEPLVQ